MNVNKQTYHTTLDPVTNERFKALAVGLNCSRKHLLTCWINNTEIKAQEPAITKEGLRILATIANNINQIAYQINSGNVIQVNFKDLVEEFKQFNSDYNEQRGE